MAQKTPGDRKPDLTSLSLIERVRAGDPEGWRRLVNLYGPLVAYWVRRGGVDQKERDDIVQEVFQSVSTGVERFRKDKPGSTFRGWLRIITRNKVVDHFREQAELPRVEGREYKEALAQLEYFDEPTRDNAEADAERQLELRALESIRGEFEPKTWEAFWKVQVIGDKVSDVAREMAITPSAVRLYRARILKRIRAELGDLESPAEAGIQG